MKQTYKKCNAQLKCFLAAFHSIHPAVPFCRLFLLYEFIFRNHLTHRVTICTICTYQVISELALQRTLRPSVRPRLIQTVKSLCTCTPPFSADMGPTGIPRGHASSSMSQPKHKHPQNACLRLRHGRNVRLGEGAAPGYEALAQRLGYVAEEVLDPRRVLPHARRHPLRVVARRMERRLGLALGRVDRHAVLPRDVRGPALRALKGLLGVGRGQREALQVG